MRKQPGRTSGTLKVRGAADTFASVDWGQCYIAPIREQTALGGGGVEPLTTTGYLYQMGESTAPRPDDEFVDSAGATWFITSVESRLAKDAGFAVHDCGFSRAG